MFTNIISFNHHNKLCSKYYLESCFTNWGNRGTEMWNNILQRFGTTSLLPDPIVLMTTLCCFCFSFELIVEKEHFSEWNMLKSQSCVPGGGSCSHCFSPVSGYRQVQDGARMILNPLVTRQIASLTHDHFMNDYFF